MADAPAPKKSRSPSNDSKQLVEIVGEYYAEAEEARITRMKRNRANWDLYMGNVDWSHKQEGQSTEHLPKLANSAEQLKAFVKRALTQYGPWFSMELAKNSPITDEQGRELLMRFLNNVVVARNGTRDFSTIVGDAVMQALMESLLILKVHGTYLNEKSFKVEPGNALAGVEPRLVKTDHQIWRLRIDLIPGEDYYPDPTGRNLYEIHEVERDWIDVWNMAQGEEAIYDAAVVEQIHDDMEKDLRLKLKARHRGQNETKHPSRRKRVQVRECWGTILGPNGRPLHEDVVLTIANGKYLIRKPTPITDIFWHGESPIIASPVIRVPHSMWHKALFDNAAQLNMALDELFNLILDGGIASVWGVRQVREHWLDDPRQISNGIPQGTTLIVNEDAPPDAKVVEQVTTGNVPPEALAVFNIADREYGQAALTNDVRLGNLPQRQVKATELVQASHNSDTLTDSFAGDLEHEVIEKVLRKSWLCMMQYADDIPAQDVVDAIGVAAAFKLSRMSEAERYATFAAGLKFKVYGLSGTLAKAREFQKLMAMNQGIATNPLMMQAYLRRFSGDKMLTHVMRSLNINPENLEQSDEEKANQDKTIGEVGQAAQITSGGGSQPNSAVASSGLQSANRSSIAQDAAPTGGVG